MERYHIFKLGLAILFYAAYCIRPMMVNGLKVDDGVGSTNETKNFIDEDFVYYQGVQGKPGVDFPVLSHIPRTTFNCRNVDSGYYADLETDCQVFHICEEGKKISFLCPNGTIFQQSELICEWWFKVNCTSSPSLYEESAEQLREENARRKSFRRVNQNHGAIMRTEERSSVSTSQNGRSFEVNNRASKKVPNENGRRENRINNHAPNYRTSPDEDLTRSSTSDFYRNRNGKKPAPFSTNSPPQVKNQRHRQDYDYQERKPTTDYQDYEDNGRKSEVRRPVPFQKTTSYHSNHQNQERKSDQQDQGFGFEERKPGRFNNGFQANHQNQGFRSNFEEKKPVPAAARFNGNNEERQSTSNTGFQQQSHSEERKPVQSQSNNGFQSTRQNQQLSSNFEEKKSVSDTTSFNRNREDRKLNRNGGFQQQNRFEERKPLHFNNGFQSNQQNEQFNSNFEEKNPVSSTTHFTRNNEGRKSNSNSGFQQHKQPVQSNSGIQSDYQNQEFSSNFEGRKLVPARTNFNQNNERKSNSNAGFQQNGNFEEKKSIQFNQGFQSNSQNQQFASNFEEKKPVPATTSFNQNIEEEKSNSNAGFQQNGNFEEKKSIQFNQGFQSNSQNQQFASNFEEKKSVSATTSFNQNIEEEKSNSETGSQQQNHSEEKKPVQLNSSFQSSPQNQQFNSNFEEKRPTQFNNRFRSDSQNQQFSSNFEEKKPVPATSFNQNIEEEKSSTQTGFQQQNHSEEKKPAQLNHSFQSSSQNQQFSSNFEEKRPVPVLTSFNRSNEDSKLNRNDDFQHFGERKQVYLNNGFQPNHQHQEFNSNFEEKNPVLATSFNRKNEERKSNFGLQQQVVPLKSDDGFQATHQNQQFSSSFEEQKPNTNSGFQQQSYNQKFSSSFEEKKPSPFRNNSDFQPSRQSQQFNLNFEEKKPISDGRSSSQNNFEKKPHLNTGFEQQTEFNNQNEDTSKPVTNNQQFGFHKSEPKSVSSGFQHPNHENKSFQQDTSLGIHNSNIKETSPESETKISYNNQQFGFHNSAQKPSPFSKHNINNKEVNPESETESGSNQRFGIQKSAQKPVYSNKNYGFQQETVFTNGSFKSVVTFNVKPVSTGFTSPEPVTKSNSYSNLEQKSVTSNSRAGFQHFKTFNEEFIENNEEEKHGTSTERQSVSSTTSTSLHFDNRNEVPTKADIVTSQKDNLISTTPSTSFQDETRVESTPQIQISSGFYGNESEATTTVSDSSLKLENSTQPKQKVLISTGFPNQKQEVAFSTVSQNQNKNKNLNVDGKDGTVKQKSTVPLTRNDIVNRRLEPSDSDEAQITQETASFYKNSFNRIDQNYKTSSPNPHPNHRETYSDLKEPKYYSSKILSAISSVTPQYLTTQPINNGRPFIGSQVGTTLRKNASTVTTITTTRNYFSTTIPPITTSSLFNLGRTDASFTTESTGTTTELFNLGSTYKISQPIAFSTQASFTTNPPRNISIPAVGSFNVGPTSTSKPRDEASTKKVIDHATVYGKFVKSSATTPSSGKISISLSKSLSGGHQVTPSPLSIPFTPKYSTSSTSKTSAEILSTSDSYNSRIPQVRFSGKVSSTIKTPGVEIHVNGNSKTSPSGLNSFSTTPKPRGKSLNFVSTSPAIINSISTTPNSIGVSERVPTSFAYFSTTPKPFSLSSTIASNPSSYFDTNSFSVTTPSPNPFGTTFTVSTTNAPTTSPSSFSSTANALHFNSLKPTASTAGKSQAPGFYVTRNGASTSKSILGEIARPRPFDLPPEPDVQGRPVYSTTDNSLTSTPTYPTYKISSASPFKVVTTLEPTQPTPFTTANPTLPSTFENVDSMINALAEMANQKDHSTPRPGLVIPPSAGPQTLHTLAVYFASALDGIASDKEENEEEEDNEENLTESELEKKKLTELLTQMTMNRYNELFSEEREDDEETTTIAPKSEDEDNDLEGQHSKNPTTTPKVRQLAKVFTQALSSYLDDPATFKKVLEEIRPTEPPALEKEESTDFGDDELLNFSDADTKSSYPPFFPTPPSVRPTWGYLIAYNTSQNLDVKNTINPTDENLQGADSQSFVSQFNKLQNKESTTKSSAQLHKESTTKSSIQLPEDHWTTSPGVTKLWNSAFSFDPASINENFETTEATTTEKETEAPEPTVHHEIKYELRALPQLELNSTQVHGILIDFMNTTKFNHNDRLQRILRKLNTTEDEFLAKMKEIETNPLTRRLILLLISECAANSTAQVETKAVPVHTLLSRTIQKNKELLETSNFSYGDRKPESSSNFEIVDPSLDEESQDTRALQLLNSLYTIASKFGKK